MSSTKKRYYLLRQNNSGGYFIEEDGLGIGQIIVIEAESYQDVLDRLNFIESKYENFFDFCPCCGKRWEFSKEEFNDAPFKIDLGEYYNLYGSNIFYIHYLNGSIERVTLDSLKSKWVGKDD